MSPETLFRRTRRNAVFLATNTFTNLQSTYLPSPATIRWTDSVPGAASQWRSYTHEETFVYASHLCDAIAEQCGGSALDYALFDQNGAPLSTQEPIQASAVWGIPACRSALPTPSAHVSLRCVVKRRFSLAS